MMQAEIRRASRPEGGTLSVLVEPDQRGDWDVDTPDRRHRVRCETLEDARRVAYV